MLDVFVFMLNVNFLNQTINPLIWQLWGGGFTGALPGNSACGVTACKDICPSLHVQMQAGTGGGSWVAAVQPLRASDTRRDAHCKINKQISLKSVALLFVLSAVKVTATCQETVIVFPRLSEPDAGLTLFMLR